MDDGVRPEPLDDRFDEGVVREIADEQLDVILRDLSPRPHSFVKRRDVEEWANAELQLPLALGEVVDDGDSVAGP